MDLRIRIRKKYLRIRNTVEPFPWASQQSSKTGEAGPEKRTVKNNNTKIQNKHKKYGGTLKIKLPFVQGDEYYTVGTWATFTSPAYMNSKIAVRCWKKFAFI